MTTASALECPAAKHAPRARLFRSPLSRGTRRPRAFCSLRMASSPQLARPDSAMEDELDKSASPGPSTTPPPGTRSLHVSAVQLALKGEDRLLLRLGMTWADGGSEATVGEILSCARGDAGRSRAHSIIPLDDASPPFPALFCVFDGHNGATAAATAADELASALAARLPGPPPASECAADADAGAAAAAAECSAAAAWRGAVTAALVGAFYDVQVAWAARGAVGGTTATAMLTAGRLITVANVGDSLAVVDTGAAVLSVCADHRIHNSKREQERVRSAGGMVSRVAECGVGPAPDSNSGLGPLRVWPGGVANARALGDFDVPPGLLLAAPHITQVRLPLDGGRIIVASGGVWDSLDVHRAAKTARSVAACEAADRVLAAALRATGGVPRDDVSIVVVDVLPRGVPSFAEACGRRLKRSASRRAALVARACQPTTTSAPARCGANRRPAHAARPPPNPPNPPAPCLPAAPPPRPPRATTTAPPTAATPPCAPRSRRLASRPPPPTARGRGRSVGDLSAHGGGYGPSVRGGRAFWGATVGLRSPSVDAEAASERDASTHSGSGAAGLLTSTPSIPGGVGGSSSRPRVETLLSLDVAVLLGVVPASAADVSARDTAHATWAPPPFCASLAAAADRAHAMFAKRSGAVTRNLPAAAANMTQHPGGPADRGRNARRRVPPHRQRPHPRCHGAPAGGAWCGGRDGRPGGVGGAGGTGEAHGEGHGRRGSRHRRGRRRRRNHGVPRAARPQRARGQDVVNDGGDDW